jgi:ribonuclease I
MWQRHGTCAGFDNQTAYFALAVAAAKKYDTDVS